MTNLVFSITMTTIINNDAYTNIENKNVKDVYESIHAPRFSSSSFDYKNGYLFIGCQ
jgi:hypothetical protein